MSIHRLFDAKPSLRADAIAYNRAREVYPGWWAPDAMLVEGA